MKAASQKTASLTTARCYLEGNLLELPALLSPRLSDSGMHRRWMVMDVLAVVMSMLPPNPQALQGWEIRTTLSEIARRLGSNRGGRKLARIRQSLEYLHTTELEFPKFLVHDGKGNSQHVCKRLRVFKRLELAQAEAARGAITVRIELADEIVRSIQSRYVKNIRYLDYFVLRQAIASKSQVARLLYLYLAKKNQPVWIEGAGKLHEKLGLLRHRPARARQYVLRAAEVLKSLGKLTSFAYVAERDQYRFEVRI